MDEEGFLKEHPSLKNKLIYAQRFATVPDVNQGYFDSEEVPLPAVEIGKIHETQIDKQNVTNALNHWLQTEKGLLKAIKKELELE